MVIAQANFNFGDRSPMETLRATVVNNLFFFFFLLFFIPSEFFWILFLYF